MAGDRRRLTVCLILAVALHVLLLVTIEIPEPRIRNPLPVIDVVLRQQSAPATPPEDIGVEPSGTTTPADADTDDALPSAAPASPSENIEAPRELSEADAGAKPRRSVYSSTPDLARAIAAEAHALSNGIGTDGEASDDNAKPAPRVRRLTGPPSGDPELAYYLDSWRRKVERVGNINYPGEARERGISGTLRLKVVIDPDGELKDVQVVASSGHALLDDGAVRVVKLAAPFSPFTPNMRAGFDSLEIERTWRFRKDRLTPMP